MRNRSERGNAQVKGQFSSRLGGAVVVVVEDGGKEHDLRGRRTHGWRHERAFSFRKWAGRSQGSAMDNRRLVRG